MVHPAPHRADPAPRNDDAPVKVVAWRIGTEVHLSDPGIEDAIEVREDAELKAIVPPPTAAEAEVLAELIARDGCLQPVVLWRREGYDVLLDGHTRVAACRRLGKAVPGCRLLDLSSMEEAIKVMVELQAGRRNLTPVQRVELALRAEPAIARAARERMLLGASTPTHNCAQGETRRLVARLAGVSHGTVERIKRVLAEGDADLVARLRSGELTPAGARRELALAERRARKVAILVACRDPQPLPPGGPFRCVVADPPWRTTRDGDDPLRTHAPYPSMRSEQIAAMPVREVVGDDAVLWLWTVNSLLGPAVEVARAWGFEQRSVLTWVKDAPGTGPWLRGQTEHALLCTRGTPTLVSIGQSTVLRAAIGSHSTKPESFFSVVEAMCRGPRLELFARRPRPGWAVWGAEVGPYTPPAPLACPAS